MRKAGVALIFIILVLTFFVAQKVVEDNSSAINGHVIEEGEELANVRVSERVVEDMKDNDNVRVYIKFKDDAVGRKGIASDVKEDLEDTINIKHEFNDKVSALISEEELEELRSNPNIESIDVVGTRQIMLQDSVGMISANNTWNVQYNGINLTGSGQTICVIDTGANYSLPSLGGCFGAGCKVVGGIDYCADDVTCTTTDSDPMDAHYHGTHAAGIAAANGSVKGVAPGAKIIMIKAANSTGTFWDDDLIKGIQWCVDNASIYNISVISMSLGGGLYTTYCNNDPLNNSINYAVANNISVVVASGNDGSTSQISAPACHQNATPVGAIAKDDSTFWYNRNSLVLLIAPGREINSTVPSGYGTLSGTSMATPHVAGAIALISQFRALEGSAEYTPSQIEDVLNDSGDYKYDTVSGGNYSRIDIYNTLVAIDNSSPETTMSSPSDNTISSVQNQTFSCSAVDALQLSNITFYLWNSSDALINQTTLNATNNSLAFALNITLNNGTYKWNCKSYDAKNNNDYGSSSNYTLRIGTSSLSINSPSDNVYTQNSSVNFNCSIQNSVANLTNMTFYLWNSTSGLVYNSTKNISGTSNSSLFNYSFIYQRQYKWNCYAYDTDLNLITGTNRTITYDDTNPVVRLIEPEDEGEEDEGDINFKYNVSDLSTIDYCYLYIDDELEEDDNNVAVNRTETMSVDLNDGNYEWYVECEDDAGNTGTSSTWEVDVVASDDDDDSSSSSSSSDSSAKTYTIADSDFASGASKYMDVGDMMKFNSEGSSHTLKILSLSSSKVKVNITSDPVILTIDIGETEKADIDNDNVYEMQVTYSEYANELGKIIIKNIDEPVPTREIQTTGETIGEGSENGEETTDEAASSFNIGEKISALWEKMGKTGRLIFYIVLGAIGAFILGMLVYYNRQRILARIPRIEIEIKKRKMPKAGKVEGV